MDVDDATEAKEDDECEDCDGASSAAAAAEVWRWPSLVSLALDSRLPSIAAGLVSMLLLLSLLSFIIMWSDEVGCGAWSQEPGSRVTGRQ